MRFDACRKLTAVLFFVFSSLTSYADEALFRLEPPDPTSKERVTLIVTQLASCPWEPYVTRDGFSIRVELGESCWLEPGPPFLITHRLDLGLLPSGTYTVTVVNEDALVGQGSFVVLDANDWVVVRPAIGPISGGSRVAIRANVACSAPDPCATPIVTFGGIPATDVKLRNGGVMVTAPPHAAGAVEVRVEGAHPHSSYAFRYYDPAEPPLSSVFEQVLVPVIYNGPGANGSVWATEIAVRNNNEMPIEYWRRAGDVARITAVASLTEALGEAPAGRFLFVPRSVSPLHFGAVVRDVSRSAQEWGTELPIVREDDFAEVVDLVNVPVDARFRHKLRIYSRDSSDQMVSIEVYSMTDGSMVRWRDIKLTSSDPCELAQPCRSVRPATVQIDDLLNDLNVPGGRVGIRLTAAWWQDSLVWGFMTVTNNETHHVTMISPQ